MNEFEKYIEKLQDLEHHKKMRIMWIGVPITMAVIIFIWLSFTNFGPQEVKTETVAVAGQEEVSAFEVLKNGFMVTLKEAGDMFKALKEKVSQTNTFEVTAPKQNNSTNSVNATTTSETK